MSTQPAQNQFCTPDDVALQAAWRRFIDYDRASDKEKKDATSIRRWVMMLGLAASCFAVVITFKDTNSIIGFLADALHWVLVLIPISMSVLMAYAMQFAPSLAWLSFRTGAELIRREIYLYRMTAGDYLGKTEEQQRQLLLDRLIAANAEVGKMGAVAPYLQSLDNLTKLVQSKTNHPEDNGFSAMTAKHYIERRVLHQRDWYIRRSLSDYQKLKLWRVMILVIGGAGTFLAAAHAEPFVAVTTALGTAMASYMELKMYGQTFPIYHPAADMVQIELDKWSILPVDRKDEPAEISGFVKRVEDIFQSERDQWARQAIRSQTNIDQSLMKAVGERAAENEKAALPVDTTLLSVHSDITTTVVASTTSTEAGAEKQTEAMEAAVSIANEQMNALASAAPIAMPATDPAVQTITATVLEIPAETTTTNPPSAVDTETTSTTQSVTASDVSESTVTEDQVTEDPVAEMPVSPDAVPAMVGSNGHNAPIHGDGSAG
jgi:hypothetical protein